MERAASDRPSIALVDDDAGLRAALSFALETAGYAVAAFPDAEAALASGDARDWRVLVLDQRLPGMTGLQLLALLRDAGVIAPAILITTHPSREARALAALAGVEIVEKPLLDEALNARVAALLA